MFNGKETVVDMSLAYLKQVKCRRPFTKWKFT